MPREVLDDEEQSDGGNYFADQQSPLEFIDSGAALLNCVLGGGWPLTRIANVVGDESTGKCGNFYLLTEWGLVHTDDIGADMPEGASEWRHTLALDFEKSVETTHFYKERVQKTNLITTEHGFELNATDVHKVIVLKDDLTLSEVFVRDVRPGDYVVISPGPGLFPVDEVALDFVPVAKVRTHTELVTPNTINADIAELLGFFVADGTLSSGSLVLTASKKWKRRAIEDLLPRALGARPVYRKGGYHFSTQTKELLVSLFGHTLDGMTARYKVVPKCILQSPRKVQAAFLRALISCDGYVTKSGLSYSSASLRLVRDVQMMLLNFGVVATYGSKWVKLDSWSDPREYFSLGIYGSRYDQFLKEIGLIIPVDKRPTVQEKSAYLSVPYAVEYLQQEVSKVRADLGWSRNGRLRDGSRFPHSRLFMYHSDTMGRQEFLRTVDLLWDFLPDNVIDTCLRILESEFVFEKVVAVEEVHKDQYVYDVHVPDGHLFWSSGFISHNTLLAIEAMANFHQQFPKGVMFYRESESAFEELYAATLGMPVEHVQFIEPDNFQTVEDFYEDLTKCVDICRRLDVPGFYTCDSLDALTSEDELESKFNAASYEVKKAKQMGKLLRMCTAKVSQARMCLMIISQTRDKIGLIPGQKTRAGGRSLNFYASQVLWLSQRDKVAETRDKVKRVIGVQVRAQMRKSKIALPYRECDVTIRFGHGIDSLATNLDWLEEVKRLDRVLEGAGIGVGAGLTRRRYENQVEEWPDDAYWKEVRRVDREVVSLWREIENQFLENSRPKYRNEE